MKKSKQISPYNNSGRANFPDRGRTGVYIIYEDKTPVYVGYSAKDLYKTMYRHFQEWNHTGQEVVSYARQYNKYKYTCRVVYCTARQAASLETALIKKYKPRDNGNRYEDKKLSRYDITTAEILNKTPSESLQFTKKELDHMRKVLEEDAAEQAAAEAMPEAMFGIVSPSSSNYERDVDRYKYFIIDTRTKKPYSGWEYKEDADETLFQLDDNYKLMTYERAKEYTGQDPKVVFKSMANKSYKEEARSYKIIVTDSKNKKQAEFYSDSFDKAVDLTIQALNKYFHYKKITLEAIQK
jgi:hypothetical protein